MSLILKCGLGGLVLVGLVLAVFFKLNNPNRKKKHRINSAVKSIHNAVKDIISTTK